ncbi:MAG: response regulator [Planctomycetes bacterium]|nr:response regulator [Planctomycetota bacterium]
MKRKALVVEDEAEVGLLLAEYLGRLGFEATLLTEGKPVIPWVYQHGPELILLDLMLPDLDGYDICRQLKLEPKTNLIPIIMVTALGEPKDKIRGLEVGANYYLPKPFTEKELTRAIHLVLDWRRDRLSRGTRGEIHFAMNSATRYLDELNDLLAALFLFTRLTQEQSQQLAVAVQEIGANAIEWGHRNQVDRIVTVTYQIDHEKVSIVVRDTGPGFNPEQLPHAAHEDDPLAHLKLRERLGLREGGFGILMARGLVDELHYNDRGNKVQLVKYFAAPA